MRSFLSLTGLCMLRKVKDNFMNEKMKGLKSVREWHALLQDPPGSFYQKLNEIYGDKDELVEESANVCLNTSLFTSTKL